MGSYFNGTEKDYAVSKGLAKAGKGRMSLEAKAAVADAKANGMTFRGKATVAVIRGSAPTGPTVSKDDTAPVQVEAEQNVYADAFYRYSRDQEFTYDVDGKAYVISGKGACMNCGYSLIGHTCNDPVVLTYHGAQSVKPKGE